jgi:phage terminase small subunit
VISENNFTPRSEEFLAVLSPRYLDTARSSRTNRSEPVFKNSRSTLEIYNSHVEINKSFYCENKRFSISEMSTASGNKQSKKAVKKKNKAKKDKKLKSKIGLSQISNIDTIHETVKEQESSDKDDNKSVKSTPLRSSNRKKQP